MSQPTGAMRTRSAGWARPTACLVCQVHGLRAGLPSHHPGTPLISQVLRGHVGPTSRFQPELQSSWNPAGASALAPVAQDQWDQWHGLLPHTERAWNQAAASQLHLQQLHELMSMLLRASSTPQNGSANPSQPAATGSPPSDGAAESTGSGGGPDPEKEPEDTSAPVRLALAALSFYRSVMSPMMAPACRYLPTCSEYSIQSYKRFGVWRGTVLTAWRLLRCSPLGSSGYDPPKWPPPGLAVLYGEGTWEYGPQVTVALGTWLFVWIASELLSELSVIFGW